MSNEERGLSEMPKPGGSMTPQWWSQVYGDKMCVTSLPYQTDKNAKKQLLDALNEDSENSKNYINTTLKIVNYVIMPASTTDHNGEIRDFVRSVLILENGERVSFGSSGVVKSLMLISTLDREAPWIPPLAKKLVARQLKDGKQMYALVDAKEAPPVAPSPKHPNK